MTLALVLFLELAAQTAPASAGMAPPVPMPLATAWACTRETLLEDVPCTVEGKTVASPGPSKEQAKENQRQARVLADDVCAAIARANEVDVDEGVLAVCRGRAATATKKCGGDGTRRLLDDGGRFNPGHARCYGALSALVREMRDLSDASSACCPCVADKCGANASKCTERMAENREPDVSAQCLASTCASECARFLLVKPRTASASGASASGASASGASASGAPASGAPASGANARSGRAR